MFENLSYKQIFQNFYNNEDLEEKLLERRYPLIELVNAPLVKIKVQLCLLASWSKEGG